MKQPYRIIIWGPGEVGGAVTRAALRRPDLKIIGAKVFNPANNGRDLGELVGAGSLGIRATTSKDDILAMEADCVVVTPIPKSIIEGLDNDVIDILESGKNVVTSAAYHNVTMPNWFASARTPTQLLRELSKTHGIAQTDAEAVALELNRLVMGVVHNKAFRPVLVPLLDRLLTSPEKPLVPLRAAPERLHAACIRGGVSLHGTGVHPTFMAERAGMTLAGALAEVSHIRFIEAADFSYTPDGMWGGLGALGFGRPLEDLDDRFLIARAGDFYYGDVIGNMAYLLYGLPASEVRLERSFRGIPAKRDFDIGSTRIRKGHAAALHMVHKGYIRSHHFFTNEECWYLGPEVEYRGDNLPFGNFHTPISYTVEVQGKPANLRAQFSYDGHGDRAGWTGDPAKIATAALRSHHAQKARKEGVTNPLTQVTALAILDAIGPVCEAAPGIVIDDPGIRYRLDG